MTGSASGSRQESAVGYLNQILGRSDNPLEEAVAVEPGNLIPASVVDTPHQELVERTAEKVAQRQPLDASESFALEAIIIPDKRPAIDIASGNFNVTHADWLAFNQPPVHQAITGALPSIGRIELPGHPSLPYGGTGFVVGDELLMTNRHVAELFAEGAGAAKPRMRLGSQAAIDFRQEADGGSAPIVVRDVLMIHPYWDMALLKVEFTSEARPPLQLAIADTDSAAREVAVIGYPAFDPRNNAEVQNQVFGGRYGIKRLQPGLLGPRWTIGSFGKDVSAITHDSSTLGGCSGAAVFHPATGEVVGLHFGGVYLARNYAVPTADLAKDGRVIDAGVNFGGTPRRQSGAWDQWWSPREQVTPAGAPAAAPAPAPAGGATVDAAPAPVEPSSTATLRLQIPLDLSITLSTGQIAAVRAAAGSESLAGDVLERAAMPLHDGPEVVRRGYRSDFLGIDVPLPEPADPALVARLEDGGYVIPYHHFSIVMDKARRLALFTAANVDASAAKKRPEAGHDYTRKGLTGLGAGDVERWFNDPRLRGTEQLPDRFFEKDNKAFDKGHLVRRDDVAWGDSFDEVRAANGDTYHVTNCSPQVAGFNRSDHRNNWGALEDLVFTQAKLERYCLFSGPVLASDDPWFAGVDDLGAVRVQIPRRFWKVVVAVKAGRLQAFAFVLEQNLANTPLEFVVPDSWADQHVPFARLQELLPAIQFPPEVVAADQFSAVATA